MFTIYSSLYPFCITSCAAFIRHTLHLIFRIEPMHGPGPTSEPNRARIGHESFCKAWARP